MSKNNTPDPLNDAIARYNSTLVPRPRQRPTPTRSWPSQKLLPLTPAQVDAMHIPDGPPSLRAWTLRRQRFLRLANGDHLLASKLSLQHP